jgi:TonB-linked SusC/RagA family outer membrane protein
MDGVEFIDFLKLRASYGIVGNDTGIGRFLYLPAQYNRDAAGYNFGYDVPQDREGASEGALGNPGVTWETSTKQDYGVELRVLDDRLDASFTYYHELRRDILTTLNTVPDYVAANFPAVNVGRVENQGYEAELSWEQNLGDFRYSIGGNLTYTHNKVLEQSEPARNEPYKRRTGHPVGQQFGYVFDGYYTEEEAQMLQEEGNGLAEPAWPVKAGYLKFKDLNGDGVINADDQRAVGYSESFPEYSIGSNMSFGYKDFGLSMTWAAATNFSERIQYSPYQVPFGGGNNFSIMQWQYEGRWTPEKAENGEKITYPRFTLDGNQQRNNKNADFWMADASYIRLKNVQLSYTLNENTLKGLGAGLREVMFYVSGYNVLTFSNMMDKYTIDPEQNALNFNAQYPVMKTYRFGIELGF